MLGDAAPLPETETVAEPGPEPEPEPTAAVEPEAGEPSASATEAEPDEVDKTVVPPQEYFTPSRPKRELLDLEPPPQPKDEPPQTPETLPLDVSGSPRAALRNAGITVPHMQQIVQLGDVRLWAFGVRADEALGWWLQIRQVHEKTGWLPVLLGSPDDWLDNGEGVLHEGDAELERMTELDAETLLHDKAAEAGEPPRGVPILPTRGDSDFAVPKSDGLIGLVEAEHSWQIPALLPWKGSTNWELYGAEHATILKHWHERHEVELVSMTWDILELYVPNPPSAEEDALDTAREVHAYCPDLMAAGVPTLDDLAVHMVRSRAWYFRWA
ncbi:hypothetical protein Snas_5847 [Stackebrandtia nassauensis DSM 44728]|uniref:DUF4253 domain-containing protein n=1 Tax=Stackebrandtia nassauensis (strain DSM 44728 / CIP 108903 / NRRL B-16338 / NBRC 102104 / LLR-40K-21) TaxID=446470 RepID=D3PZ47_STANL|nr:hypothetical protein Snas_5847 [Stackebrandtia nassauensis DSM 44728]